MWKIIQARRNKLKISPEKNNNPKESLYVEKSVTVPPFSNISVQLKNVELTLRGQIGTSERCCFYIPEMRLFFDAGVDISFPFKADHIFISQTTTNHSLRLPSLLTEKCETFPITYVPAERVKLFRDFVQTWKALMYPSAGEVIGEGVVSVNGTKEYPIVGDYLMKSYKFSYNTMTNEPVRGWGLIRKKYQLFGCFESLEPAEVSHLDANGIKTTVTTKQPLVAYVVGTSIEVFNQHPDLLCYRNIIVECTFLDEEKQKDVGVTHAMNWTVLESVVANNPNVYFILVHFSLEYNIEDIKIFASQVEEEFSNVFVWQ